MPMLHKVVTKMQLLDRVSTKKQVLHKVIPKMQLLHKVTTKPKDHDTRPIPAWYFWQVPKWAKTHTSIEHNKHQTQTAT